MSIVHIDGDILLYSVGFASEDDPIAFGCHSLKQMINRIKNETMCEEYIVHLSGLENFRDKIGTIQKYKGNRKDVTKPKNFEELKAYLLDNHPCCLAMDKEADDTMGEMAVLDVDVIASIDKDMDNIPGHHYNWRRGECYTVSQEEADEHFILQLLTGDATDNIPGLYKITGTKATKKIKQEVLEEEGFLNRFDKVLGIYYRELCRKNEVIASSIQRDEAINIVMEIAQLLWIQRPGFLSVVDYIEHLEELNAEKEEAETLEDIPERIGGDCSTAAT